ncbi:MAG: DEAD/DEAH box helicase family protein [Candidatus Sigynarchaeota archaeon]
MNQFPPECKFKFPWRPYQEMVLKELKAHLGDNKLHVVAAPGSGKTILGLEVARQLNRPTLVLAPSIGIKDQWPDKLIDSFMPTKDMPSWISKDIKKPAFFTVSTYQGLHVAYTGKADEAEEGEEETAQDGGGDGLRPPTLKGLSKKKEDSKPVDEPAPSPPGEPPATNDAAPAPAPASAEKTRKPGEKKPDKPEKPEKAENPAKPEKPEKAAGARKQKADIVALLKDAGVKTVIVDECHHLRTAWWTSLNAVIAGLDNPTIVALTATPPYDVDPAEWDRYTQLCGPIDAEINVPELVKVQNLCPHQDYVFFSTPTKEEMESIKKFETEIDGFIKNLLASQDFTKLVANHKWIKQPRANEEAILSNPELFSSMLVYLNHVKHPIPTEAVELVSGSGQVKIPALNNHWMSVLLSAIFADPESEGRLPAPVEQLRKQLAKIGAIERRKVSLNLDEKIAKLLASSISKINGIQQIVQAEYKSLGDKLRMVVLTDYIRREMLPADKNDTVVLNKIGIVPLFDALRRMNVPNMTLGALSGKFIVIPRSAGELLKTCIKDLKIDEKQVQLAELYFDPDYLQVDFSGAAEKRMVGILTEVFTRGGINVLVGTKSLLGEGWDAPCINSLILATFVGSFMFSNQMRGRAIRVEKNNPTKTGNIWHLVCVMPDSQTPGDDYATMTRRFKSFVGVAQGSPVIENGMSRLDLPAPPFSQATLEQLNARTMKRAADRDGMRKAWDTALAKAGTKSKLVEKIVSKEESKPKGFSAGKVKGVDIKDAATVVLRSLCATDQIKTRYQDLEIKTEKAGDTITCFLQGGTRKEQSMFINALQEVIEPPRNPKYVVAATKGKKIDLEQVYAVPELIGASKDWAGYYSEQWKKHVGDNELIYTRTKEGRVLLLQARTNAEYAGRVGRSEILSRWQ